jgi:hypothetical protein
VSTTDDGGVIISVLKDDNGQRFSVEFYDDLYLYHSIG